MKEKETHEILINSIYKILSEKNLEGVQFEVKEKKIKKSKDKLRPNGIVAPIRKGLPKIRLVIDITCIPTQPYVF